MLFEFVLKPINNVGLFSNPETNTNHLHWFGFTDGYYRMNLGEAKLLDFSEETVAFYRKESPLAVSGTYLDNWVDYQVARFYEDCLANFPYVVETVPEDLWEYLEFEYETQGEWRRYWRDLTDKFNREETDKFYDAFEWMTYERYLTGGHITSYNILSWSDGKNINIYWNNEGIYSHDEVPAWSAQKGKFSLPLNDYIEEMKSFHKRLFEQMADRIDEVCKKWDRGDVIIDCVSMKEDHKKREENFAKVLSTLPNKTDWNHVRECLNWLHQTYPKNHN